MARGRPFLVHRSDQARRRQQRAGVQLEGPRASDSAAPHSGRRFQRKATSRARIPIRRPSGTTIDYDQNGDGKIEDFDEMMHRTCGTAAIKNDLLFIADFSGMLHCLDAKTGKPHWTYDLLSACWGSCLIVEDKVYVGNEDGDVFIFRLSPKMEIISKNVRRQAGRNRNGQRRLQHTDRRPECALHLEPQLPVRNHELAASGGDEVTGGGEGVGSLFRP